MTELVPIDLLREAALAALNAYSDYSGFSVGSAVRTSDGSVFTGANMENASYGLTICAEVGALQAATTAGKLADVVQIAVAGGSAEEKAKLALVDRDELGANIVVAGPVDRAEKEREAFVTPCGRCRQLIYESSCLSGVDIEVWCADLNLTVTKCFKISALLPSGFGPDNLRTSKGHSNGAHISQRKVGGK